MKCESCDKEGEWCLDPYQQEINDTEDYVWLCAECYADRASDI